MSENTVRAKFYCNTKAQMSSSPEPFIDNYKFSAVTSGSDENKKFWKWTPSGMIELSSIRDDIFEVGKEYYLDFTPVPEPEKA